MDVVNNNLSFYSSINWNFGFQASTSRVNAVYDVRCIVIKA